MSDLRYLIAGLALLAASCSQDPAETAGAAASRAPDAIAAALENPARPAADRADDEMRRPRDVLAFIGIKPGMTIFEMEAGEGYYTELFSTLAGPEGRVIMQEAPAFRRFLEEKINARIIGGRLANVEMQYSLFDALGAEDGAANIVTWMLGPHELYFEPTGGETFGDDEGAFAEAYRVLKPGGYFYIIDHAAPAGYSAQAGGNIHRIDEAIARGLAEGAGFKFVEASDLLRNPDDLRTESVFNPEIRRRTDRFILKYQKPPEGTRP